MRLKQRVGDFHVRELLNDDLLKERGDYIVYRVTKKKMTTPEVVRILAEEAGVKTGDINFCGLKDRQGVTTQFMSMPRRHRDVSINEGGLRIERAGFMDEPLSSSMSRGNAFEVNVRALSGREVHVLRSNIDAVRDGGLVNYFDDQRFGNLRHDQGWVARELMLGNHETALKRMLFWPSPFDSSRYERFKADLGRHWGDWDRCGGIARGFGEHFSIFDHLGKNPGDFAGAFYHAPTRIRLIHLYAYQSHVWNRAAALLVREAVEKDERVVLPSDEGALPSYGETVPALLLDHGTLRLPGSHLEDTGKQRELFEKVLAAEGLKPEQFHIEGVPGFALKGEDRPLMVTPGHLRVRPAEEDHLNYGGRMVRLRFELGRGSYATLVVKRLFEAVGEERQGANEGDRSVARGRERDREDRGGRPGGGGYQRDDRGGGGGYQRQGGGGYQRPAASGGGGERGERGGYVGRSSGSNYGGRPGGGGYGGRQSGDGERGGGYRRDDRDGGSRGGGRPSGGGERGGGYGGRPSGGGERGGGYRRDDGGGRPSNRDGGNRDGGERRPRPSNKPSGGNPWGSGSSSDGDSKKSSGDSNE